MAITPREILKNTFKEIIFSKILKQKRWVLRPSSLSLENWRTKSWTKPMNGTEVLLRETSPRKGAAGIQSRPVSRVFFPRYSREQFNIQAN